MAARAPLTKRMSPAQWMALDALAAVAMLAAVVAFAAFGHARHHTAHPLLLYLLAPLASLPLAVRRRWPLAVLTVVLTASVAFGVASSATATVTGATYVLYTAAVQVERRWSLLALAAVEVGVVVSFVLITRSTSNLVNGAFTALVQVTVWVIGYGVRRQRAYSASLRERSIRQALAEQRLQIARELHDVIAHAMSVIAVQAGVGSHLIATRPDQAAESLAAIEATARSALSETRYLLDTVTRIQPAWFRRPGWAA
jgi:signal transduction histidine kinase